MKTVNCIVIDDEPPAIRQMEEYISKVHYLNLLATFSDPMDSLTFLKDQKVDLIFLDIQMEGLSGIELLKLGTVMPRVILTTAFDSYALQAYDLDVDDYLLKPFSFTRFLRSCEKVYHKLVAESPPARQVKEAESELKKYFFVKTDSKIQRVNFDEILYIEGMKEYLRIVLVKGRLLTLQSFNEILRALPELEFLRVHKSYIVALSKIDYIKKDRIHIGDKVIPVGGTFKNKLLESINSRMNSS